MVNGIIPLYKPAGMTSHDCVAKIRKILNTKKVGHTGTLDPDVDGVLPICVGSATKVVDYVMDSGKSYTGEITLGFSTDTEDLSGKVIRTENLKQSISDDLINSKMNELTGEIIQIPPMYSAVKVNGKKLYQYAREGIVVKRPERKIFVNKFTLDGISKFDENLHQQKINFTVDCQKGTYVRTLATDLGNKLEVPAVMSDLTRVKSGGFGIKDTVTLEDLAVAVSKENFDFLKPIELVFRKYPKIELTDEDWIKVTNGATIKITGTDENIIGVYYDNKIKALYRKLNDNNIYKAEKMLLQNKD